MCAVLCCGPCFDTKNLSDDGSIYPWLDLLLSSKDDKVSNNFSLTVFTLLLLNKKVGLRFKLFFHVK